MQGAIDGKHKICMLESSVTAIKGAYNIPDANIIAMDAQARRPVAGRARRRHTHLAARLRLVHSSGFSLNKCSDKSVRVLRDRQSSACIMLTAPPQSWANTVSKKPAPPPPPPPPSPPPPPPPPPHIQYIVLVVLIYQCRGCAPTYSLIGTAHRPHRACSSAMRGAMHQQMHAVAVCNV